MPYPNPYVFESTTASSAETPGEQTVSPSPADEDMALPFTPPPPGPPEEDHLPDDGAPVEEPTFPEPPGSLFDLPEESLRPEAPSAEETSDEPASDAGELPPPAITPVVAPAPEPDGGIDDTATELPPLPADNPALFPLDVLLSTTPSVHGVEVRATLGLCRGVATVSPPAANPEQLTTTMQQAQSAATRELVRAASAEGADLVVGLRFEAVPVPEGITVMAYGTALRTNRR